MVDNCVKLVVNAIDLERRLFPIVIEEAFLLFLSVHLFIATHC